MLGFATRARLLQDLALSDNANFKGATIAGEELAVTDAAFALLGPSMGSISSTLTLPSAAAALNAVSTDVGDTGDIYVEYLDAEYRERAATVTLTGTTPVQVVASARRINRVIYLPGSNLGTISLDVGGTVLSKIRVGDGVARVALYTTPRGQRVSLLSALVNVESPKTADMRLRAKARTQPGIYTVGRAYAVTEFALVDIPLPPPIEDLLMESYGVDIWLDAKTTAGGGNGIVGGYFQIVAERTTDPDAVGFG